MMSRMGVRMGNIKAEERDMSSFVEELKDTLTYNYGTNMSRIVRMLSDEYSKTYCSHDDAVEYAINKSEGSCLYCGVEFYNEEFEADKEISIHLDHIYPASYGGLFTKGNVALSCSTCNIAKGNRDPVHYYKTKLYEDLDCKFSDIASFREFLDNYTAPYRLEFPKSYNLYLKSRAKNVINIEDVIEVMVRPLKDIKMNAMRKPTLRVRKPKVVRFAIGKAPSAWDLTLRQKKMLVGIFRIIDETDEGINCTLSELRKILGFHNLRHLITIAQNLHAIRDALVADSRNPSSMHKKFQVSAEDNLVKIADSDELLEAGRELGFDKFSKKNYSDYDKLSSTYTQNIYSILVRFGIGNEIVIEVDKLRELLAVPEGYSFGVFNAKVIKPSVEELQSVFKGLRVTQMRGSYGKSIETLVFTFQKENVKPKK